jgi:NADP-dependent 3-hydroxy acid dehydrogenase YdfG
MDSIENKVVVITGGASGVGRGMAEAFADAGARLVLADINETRLAEMAELLAKRTDLLTRVVNVREAREMEGLAAAAYAKFGAVHVLCNNAGVACSGLVWEQSTTDWYWIFETNVLSVVHGLRAFVPRMLKQKERSHIVNTSSMLGLSSAPLTGLYGASKQAVLGITESLHTELKLMEANIAVSVLCPGPVQTNVAEEPGRRHEKHGSHPLPGVLAEIDSALKAVVANGMSPRQVGDCVVKAVRKEMFWILPMPELSNADRRLAEIHNAISLGR